MEWQLSNSNGYLKFISDFQLRIFRKTTLNYKYGNKTNGLCRDLNAHNLRVPVFLFANCCHSTFLSTFVLSNELKFNLEFDLLSNELSYVRFPTSPRVKPQFVICSCHVVSRISSLSMTT